jgi:hypothetical protein
MSDVTSDLPENIQLAINDHEAAKQAFIDSRETYKLVLAKLDKHRKTVQAARTEAEQAGQKWRELLAQNDGVLNKEIKALRHKEAESKELALEFDKIIHEVLDIASQKEKEAYHLFAVHSKAYQLVTHLYDAYTTQKVTTELFSLPEAKVFAWILNRQVQDQIKKCILNYGIDATASGTKEYKELAKKIVATKLLDTFLELVKDVSYTGK